MKTYVLNFLRFLFGKIGRHPVLIFILWCLLPETIIIVLATIYFEGSFVKRVFEGFALGVPVTLVVAANSFLGFTATDQWLALPETRKQLQGIVKVWDEYDTNNGDAGHYYSIPICGVDVIDDETLEVRSETVEPISWGMDLKTLMSMVPVGTTVPVIVFKGPSGRKYVRPKIQELINDRLPAYDRRFTMIET